MLMGGLCDRWEDNRREPLSGHLRGEGHRRAQPPRVP
jgi:hypothetical protein